MPALEILLSDLKTQFERHLTSIEDYEQQIRPQIQYYRWATEPQFHLALLQIERARLAKGKVFTEPQDETYIRLGYDIENRIIFEERTTHSSSGPYLKFIEYHPDSIKVYQYKQGKIDGLAYLTIKENQPDIHVSYSPGVVNTAEQYFFEQGRLTSIQTLNNYDAFKQDAQQPLYSITYDTLGAIQLITRTDQPSKFFPTGQEINIYKKSKYSLKALSDIFLDESLLYLQDQFQTQEGFLTADCLLLVLHNAFNGESWLPFQLHELPVKAPLTNSIAVADYLDFSLLAPPEDSNYPKRLTEVSQLLMQEIELKEKYELPMKLLEKLGKRVVAARSEQTKGTPLKVLVLDLPDDFYEEVLSVLKRLYPAKTCKAFLEK